MNEFIPTSCSLTGATATVYFSSTVDLEGHLQTNGGQSLSAHVMFSVVAYRSYFSSSTFFLYPPVYDRRGGRVLLYSKSFKTRSKRVTTTSLPSSEIACGNSGPFV